MGLRITDWDNAFLPFYAASAGVYVIKSGKGVFGGLTINGGTLGSGRVCDGTNSSAQKLMQLPAAPSASQNYSYNVKFQSGLTLVLCSATDLTLRYY